MPSHRVQLSTVEARQEAQELQGQVDAATQRAIDSRADNQPTKKAYSRPQAMWKNWCEEMRFPDGPLVNEGKFCLFFEQVIKPYRVASAPAPANKKRKRGPNEAAVPTPAEDADAEALARAMGISREELAAMRADDRDDGDDRDDEDATGAPISTSTLDVWVAAVMELYQRQCSMRQNCHPNPRGDALTSKIDAYRRNHDARGLDGIVAGYSDAEFLSLQRCLLDRSQGSDGVFFRTRLDVLWGHFLVLRGQTRRRAELADLCFLPLPATEGPSDCDAVVLRGKTNAYGKSHFMGAIRHRNPLLCSVGALGLYLFWRWHIRGESTPNFRSHSSWYPVKLLAARDDRTGTQELGYKSQYEATWGAFVLAGISSVQKTHVMRGCGARAAEVHGVSEKQISRAGGWDPTVMVRAYLLGLPLKFMRWKEPGQYHLPRAAIEPPEVLQR